MEQLPYFNKITLGEILGKSGENLNYWVKKLLKTGDIITLKNGLYVSRQYLFGLDRNPALKELYFEYLANVLRYPSYITLEYAMSKYGLIPESIFSITSVTLKSSRIYQNNLVSFSYRSIKPELFEGFVNVDFEGKRVKIATKAKTLYDFLYFKKFVSLQQLKNELNSSLRINWDNFNMNDKVEFKQFTEKLGIVKMQRVIKILKW